MSAQPNHADWCLTHWAQSFDKRRCVMADAKGRGCEIVEARVIPITEVSDGGEDRP